MNKLTIFVVLGLCSALIACDDDDTDRTDAGDADLTGEGDTDLTDAGDADAEDVGEGDTGVSGCQPVARTPSDPPEIGDTCHNVIHAVCDGNRIIECGEQSDGSLQWQLGQVCERSDGLECDRGECQEICETCTEGERRCAFSASGSVQRCVWDSVANCIVWETLGHCGYDRECICFRGECIEHCGVCDPGEMDDRCVGTSGMVYGCVQNWSSGCMEWSPMVGCKD